MLKKLYNLRPYSWIDLFLIGLVGKFSLMDKLVFQRKDLFMAIGLLSLWCFFNLALELKHNYSYRAKPNIVSLVICIVFASVSGVYFNTLSIIFIISSILLVSIYLLKNKNKILGNLSSIVRGAIQNSYFFYALMFYTQTISNIHIIIGIIIFLVYSARALIGDIRDMKHNKEVGKKTFIVNYGTNLGIILIEILILSSILILIRYFDFLATIPLLILCIILPFFRNGYILHQLMIIITSFLSINLISYFTNNNLIFMNVIFIGLFLNMIFYPLLKRKSNPD
jgi:4-hydroxybenzoate polyprenyltransferase